MSNVSIFEKKWLDIVFEGKNKEYGAYQLRRETTKTNLLAFLFGILFIGGGALGLTAFGKTPEKKDIIIPVDLSDKPVIDTPNKIKDEKIEEEKVKPQESKPAQSSQAFTDNNKLVVAATNQAATDVPTNDTRNSGSGNPEDGKGGGAVTVTTDTGGHETGTGGEEKPAEEILTANPEFAPMFPGGMKKFGEYIVNNLRAETEEEEQYTVTLKFVVETDGSITDVQVAKSSGLKSIDNEAVRVLKSLKTKWIPGMMGKTPVRTQFQQSIVISN